MLELEVRGGDLPALVLAADEVEGGDADVVEVHGLLDAGAGAGLTAGDEQVHGLDCDARQVGGHHEPAEVLVALGVGVGDGDGPHEVAAVVAADEYLLAVQDVLVAVADGLGLHVGEVGAGLGLGEELPGAYATGEDGREEGLLLLLRAPD